MSFINSNIQYCPQSISHAIKRHNHISRLHRCWAEIPKLKATAVSSHMSVGWGSEESSDLLLSPLLCALSGRRRQSCVSNSCEWDLRPELLCTESFYCGLRMSVSLGEKGPRRRTVCAQVLEILTWRGLNVWTRSCVAVDAARSLVCFTTSTKDGDDDAK